ncbi:MAG: spermidine/putrescine ABC transporter substrate-binding protein [Clostridiales bacterium]|nr:spermidine/putrescine ABC transporter substrate-binding protein [Clostridiales bacterium]
MKKLLAILLAAVLLLGLLAGCASGRETLTILNWGDYMDPDIIKQFERENNVRIRYSTMASNEEMLVKLQAPDNVFDLCFPSDYIIERLIKLDLLHPLNKENIPNRANIGERFWAATDVFDPGNVYSVPYMWGTVGILYNEDKVDEPVDSWSILWDERYAGQVIMYDSVRDSIAVALLKLGFDINTRDADEVTQARDALIWQRKNIVKGYGTDEIKADMVNGKAALAVVYSGDAVYAMDENDTLNYSVPLEGSNLWFDNMIIPKTSKNKELAEKFINFLCDAEVAAQNTEYIGYSTPNDAAFVLLPAWLRACEAYNPPPDVWARTQVFRDLGDFARVFNEAWDAVMKS